MISEDIRQRRKKLGAVLSALPKVLPQQEHAVPCPSLGAMLWTGPHTWSGPMDYMRRYPDPGMWGLVITCCYSLRGSTMHG